MDKDQDSCEPSATISSLVPYFPTISVDPGQTGVTATLIRQMHPTPDGKKRGSICTFDSFFIQESVPPNRCTMDEIRNNRRKHTRVRLNVGGTVHEVLWRNLKRIPFSRLGKLRAANTHERIIQLCDDYSLEQNEFYFDRNPTAFTCILNMYRVGRLHIMDDICVISFLEELEYWGLSEHWMETCCQGKYYHKKEMVHEELRKINESFELQEKGETIACGKFARSRQRIWNIMEKPQTSIAARVSLTHQAPSDSAVQVFWWRDTGEVKPHARRPKPEYFY
ncbi:Potassium voltage-gated channel subfamily B member 2 [Cichlidogyrus casuarinus]|uniref:Potassium voltage-gated channel subfamily B member 2 n=1 Tax=Cichlidogyrus casuarinus TaxID=1844966 RepID=A0ABD2PV29_9PLAT